MNPAAAVVRELPLVRVALVREGRTVTTTLPSVLKPEEAAALLAPLLRDRDREAFAVLLLDNAHRPLGVHIAHEGSLNECGVHPREVFKAAILANAAAVILAHNHPSGDPHPSPDDYALTRRLREAGALLGIDVLDHIVIGWRQAVSMKQAEVWSGPVAPLTFSFTGEE